MMKMEVSDDVHQRLRGVTESLFSDSSLRDELTDEQGQRLLDWGAAVLQRAGVASVSFPEEEALALLDEKLTAVKLIMHSVNQLTVHPGLLPEEDLVNARLVRLGKNLQWLIRGTTDRKRVHRIRHFKQQRDDIDRETAFQLLLEILYADDIRQSD